MDTEYLRKHMAGLHPKLTDEESYLHAAVLVPLVQIDGEDHILFEVRSAAMRRQPGDISFPGGRYEAGDRSAAEAAIRECSEELGIAESAIEYIGSLDRINSAIGVRIDATVGRLHTRAFRPEPAEVGEVFTVPIRTLLEMTPRKAIMEVGSRPTGDFPFDLLPDYNPEWRVRQTYPVYFYPYKGKNIWGLTALVLTNFLRIYRDAEALR